MAPFTHPTGEPAIQTRYQAQNEPDSTWTGPPDRRLTHPTGEPAIQTRYQAQNQPDSTWTGPPDRRLTHPTGGEEP